MYDKLILMAHTRMREKKTFFFIFDSSNYVILPLKVVWFNIITQNNVDNIIL